MESMSNRKEEYSSPLCEMMTIDTGVAVVAMSGHSLENPEDDGEWDW